MKTLPILRISGLLNFSLFLAWSHAGEVTRQDPVPHTSINASPAAVHWLTGEGADLGGILFPHAHFQAVYGQTTADHLEHFGAGHHDPVSDGWTIQGFEVGTSLRAGKHFEGFTTYHLYQDAHTRNWDDDFEEWFGKIKNLPGGFELRGGRYFNRFGFHNSTHMHGWSHVDNHLVNGRFLGHDSLTSIGAELTWNLPTPWTSLLSLSIGEAQSHADHGHEDHESHADEHKHHRFEGEDALFADTVIVANWANQHDLNDFHQLRFGLSGAWGDNHMNELTQVYGVHLQYEWRQNGYEAGGRYFRWRTEAMVRDFDLRAVHEEDEETHEEHAPDQAHVHRGSETEFGIYTAFAYGLDNGLEFGLRAEYVGGIANTSLREHHRLSPNVTFFLNPSRTVYLRGQYNYDYSPDYDDQHGVWLQIGFNWGGAEVR